MRKDRLNANCKECGGEFITWECRRKIGQGYFCSKKCAIEYRKKNPSKYKKPTHLHKVGEEHPSWKGGKKEDKDGYYYVWVGKENHPHATADGYVFEHRHVMEQHLGRYLKPTEIVHHKDRNVKNNDINNLVLCKNQKEHLAQHLAEKYNRPILKNAWHVIWEKCQECETTEIKHQGRGLCKRCFMRDWRKRKRLERKKTS